MNRLIVALLMGSVPLAWAESSAIYSGLDMVESSSAVVRQLSSSEQAWLSEISIGEKNNGDKISDVKISDSSLTNPEISVASLYQPQVFSSASNIIRLPVKRMTFAEVPNGIRIEQSGLAVVIPVLAVQISSGDLFSEQLQHWLAQDLTELIQTFKVIQQEAHWSDLELMQITRLYSASQLDSAEQQAFLASFWVQAGYRVALAKQTKTWSLLLKLPVAIADAVQISTLPGDWLPLNELSQGETASIYPMPTNSLGQSLSIIALGDRSISRGTHRQTYGDSRQVSANNVLQIEVPQHWLFVSELQASISYQARQQLPVHLMTALVELFEASDDVASTQLFAQWLEAEFELVDIPVSLHQMFYSAITTERSRLILLAHYWRFTTGQTAAFISQNEQNYLALRLNDNQSVEPAIHKRRQRWWLWSADLNSKNFTYPDNSANWHFIP